MVDRLLRGERWEKAESSWLKSDAHDKRQLMGIRGVVVTCSCWFWCQAPRIKIFISPPSEKNNMDRDREELGLCCSIVYRFLTVSRPKTNHKFCGPIARANYAANKWPIMKESSIFCVLQWLLLLLVLLLLLQPLGQPDKVNIYLCHIRKRRGKSPKCRSFPFFPSFFFFWG